MFQQRTSSQKPGDELLANFRQQFPEVAAATSASPTAGPVGATAAADPNNPVSAQERTNSIGHEAFRDEDPTPRASNDPWRFTPSLLDPNSFSFSTFGNIPQGYYTPTPGGTNTLYHPQAGDLHTPTMGLSMGLGTPMSMPSATEGNMHPNAPMLGLAGYQQTIHHPQFHGFNAFIQPPAHQASFAPSTFVHHDTGYETMDQDGSPLGPSAVDERIVSIDHSIQGQTSLVGFQPGHFGTTLSATAAPLPPSAEKFRFHATLNAPTAMIKHADEIPVTYLNKGQAYSLSIVDSMSTVPIVPGTRYRTYVRISFEDEQQRQKPGVCWSLWKEGRGTNEAHQRGGKLQAVEYVEAGQPAEGDDKRTRVELESATFNGFSVTWTPGANGPAECSVAVRFNFLSTDFSHSKGVKGIPVRLCAKTNQIPQDPTRVPPESAPEICYCKVKLFRDHGAERKLSNDVAHVKKTIDKLKQQIAQAESGMKDFGKRKRTGASQAKTQDAHRPGKVLKHKRTWSMSSASSAGGNGRPPAEEDLQYKLQTLQDMFTSTRPASILYLRGEKLDDPDLHPVVLPGEPLDLTKAESKDNIAWRSEPSSVGGSSLVSPSPSSLSLNSQLSMGGGGNTQWQDPNWLGSVKAREQPTKVKQTRDDAGNLINWIEALGVDPSYKPPLERSKKPVACFYVAQRSSLASGGAPECHRAIYLMQRTVKEFILRLALKWNFDPAKVVRVIHVLNRGLEVEMDDDVIRELDEGQDILLDIVEVNGGASPATGEWEMAVDSPGESETSQPGYQLRLTF